MVAKLTKEPKQRKKKNTEDNAKPPSPPSRSGIKQALRLKCNTLIHYETTKQQGISACCYTIDYFLRPQNDFFYRGSCTLNEVKYSYLPYAPINVNPLEGGGEAGQRRGI